MATDLLPPPREPCELIDVGMRAEELSYDGFWLGELWGSSSVVPLTAIATETKNLELGTAILNVFSRTPAVLAMTAATLDDISDGRFRLGVGTSTRKAIEDLHGMNWAAHNPVRRAHETIELTKTLLQSGGPIEYDGEVFNVQDFPPLDADIPIYHAALGEANRRVVARLCDGWIPHNVPFPDLEEAYTYITDIMNESGRNADIEVAPYVPSAVADDPEVARDVIRGHIAYYIGNGRGYKHAVGQRFPDGAAAVADAWRRGDRKGATGKVTDKMVEALGVAGTPEQARKQFREVAAIDCVTRPIVVIPSYADTNLADRTIEELAPANNKTAS